jgi:protein phosphatase
MKIASYSHIGQRENNEDYVKSSSSVCLVCDGMGGYLKGEVASRLIAEGIHKYFNLLKLSEVTEDDIREIIITVQNDLNNRLTEYPNEENMGTTLASVFFTKKKIVIAHIGDSRVYYIKPEKGVFWRTSDHSVVQELINSGIINEDEARTHKKKNIITKAIQANNDGITQTADFSIITDCCAGDLIFLCTDGVNETFNDRDIVGLLSDKTKSIDEKIKHIQDRCLGSSSDNNSAIIIELEKRDSFSHKADSQVNWISISQLLSVSGESEFVIAEEIESASRKFSFFHKFFKRK